MQVLHLSDVIEGSGIFVHLQIPCFVSVIVVGSNSEENMVLQPICIAILCLCITNDKTRTLYL